MVKLHSFAITLSLSFSKKTTRVPHTQRNDAFVLWYGGTRRLRVWWSMVHGFVIMVTAVILKDARRFCFPYLRQRERVAEMKLSVHVWVRERHKVRLIGVGFAILQMQQRGSNASKEWEMGDGEVLCFVSIQRKE